LIKFLLLVLAIQILNLSVYGRECADAVEYGSIGEYNQMDSVVEYITEILLDYKDAFPENGHNNRRAGMLHQFKHITIKMVSVRKKAFIQSAFFVINHPKPSLKNSYKYLFAGEITPQPPKA